MGSPWRRPRQIAVKPVNSLRCEGSHQDRHSYHWLGKGNVLTHHVSARTGGGTVGDGCIRLRSLDIGIFVATICMEICDGDTAIGSEGISCTQLGYSVL